MGRYDGQLMLMAGDYRREQYAQTVEARGAGMTEAQVIAELAEIDALAGRIRECRGPLFAQIKISAEPGPPALPPRDGPHLKTRFRRALLGDDAV